MEKELPGIRAAVAPALNAAVAASGAPERAVKLAFALASRYAQPQRAVSCALNGFRRDALCAKLVADELADEVRALECCAAPSSYAWLLAAPIGRFELPDVALATIMRLRLALCVLLPTSITCKTVAGLTPKVCTLRGCARGSATAHGLSCKCGGLAIHSHDFIRTHLSDVVRTWCVAIAEESRMLLAGAFSASRMDILALSAGLGRGVLACDLTRRFGVDFAGLAAAEVGKERKYGSKYVVPVTMRGFAYDELGRCGPHAYSVVDMLVSAGVRAGAGHYEDLKLELLATFGIALAMATTVRLARAAAVNHDTSAHAPLERDLVKAGQEHATGASFGFLRPSQPRQVARSIAIFPGRGATRGTRRRLAVPAHAPPDPPPHPSGGARGAGSSSSETSSSASSSRPALSSAASSPESASRSSTPVSDGGLLSPTPTGAGAAFDSTSMPSSHSSRRLAPTDVARVPMRPVAPAASRRRHSPHVHDAQCSRSCVSAGSSPLPPMSPSHAVALAASDVLM
jgi:hypothetical protein